MALKVENLGSVIDKLIEKTLSRGLSWTESSEPTEFVTQSTKFFYYIKSRDEDGVAPFRLQVYKKANTVPKLLEESSVDHEPEVRTKFAQLFEVARRSVLGLTQALETEILEDLDDVGS